MVEKWRETGCVQSTNVWVKYDDDACVCARVACVFARGMCVRARGMCVRARDMRVQGCKHPSGNMIVVGRSFFYVFCKMSRTMLS